MARRKMPILPDFEETAGFRATLLYLFPPESVETVRDFGRLLFYMILAGEPHYPEHESQTRRELVAAMEDLQHVQSFLAYIARNAEDVELEPPDLRRAQLAGRLAEEVDRVIKDLKKGLR